MSDTIVVDKIKERLGFQVCRYEDPPDYHTGDTEVHYDICYESGIDPREATEEEIELWELLLTYHKENIKLKERIRCLESVLREAEEVCDAVVDTPNDIPLNKNVESKALLVTHTIIILEADGTLSRKV
jgi:hypothetical protein